MTTNNKYNCGALDNMSRCNNLCFAVAHYVDSDGEERTYTTFYNSNEFAAMQAGLFYRAYVSESISIEKTYDYRVGANHACFADYGNDFAEKLDITDAPAWIGEEREIDVAELLNAAIRAYRYKQEDEEAKIIKRCAIGWREYAILDNLASVRFDVSQNTISATSADGDKCTFLIRGGSLVVVG